MKRINLFTIVVGILLIFFVFYPVFYLSTQEIIKIDVNDKERVIQKNGDDIKSRYLIYAKDEVFENTDNLFFFKFNSSDIQNELELNQEYQVKVIGWRIPILSKYRNIVKIIYEEND